MWRLSGYWQQLLGIVDTSQGEGGEILKKKFWPCLCINVAQSPMFFFRRYSLFHQDTPCNPSSIPFVLVPASITMFLMHFVTLCKKCLKKTSTVVSCLMKCQSERMSGLIRNLTALSDLRILKSGQDMQHCISCSTFHGPWSALEVEAASGLLPQLWKY